MSNQLIRNADSVDSSVASVPGRRAFPLRTLMVCFTTWLIATEILIFDQIRFNAKAELLDEAARALREQQIIVPGERSLNLSGKAKMERL
jgi:hypothetical protein